jgi:outer membrane protein OmpA-like peptidoglycan-associated protein
MGAPPPNPRPRLIAGLASAVAAAVVTVASVPAAAQTPTQALALDRFDPAPAGDRFFGVQSPFAAGPLTPHVMIIADYAHDPLVLRRLSSNQDVGNVVTNQLFVHINGGLSLWNRLLINLDIPVEVFGNGGNPSDVPNGSAAPLNFSSPSGAHFGDLRIGLRARLFGEYHDPFQIAVGGYLWVPTGSKDAFISTGQVRGLPQLIMGGRAGDRFVWTTAGGPEIQGTQTYAGIDQGSMFKYGAGVAVLFGDDRSVQLGPEISGTVSLKDVQKRTTNAEAMLDLRYRFLGDWEIGAGAGPGLTSGIGTPDVRAVLSIAYTPDQKRDRDHDGIPDDVDACPDEPGIKTDDPKTNGCPPPKDRDGDGILDDDDACPDIPGVKSDDPKKNGCPLAKDRDHDGIPDDEDACPDVKGVKTNDPKTNGCPPDRDGDGIIDAEDACPDVPGVKSDDPKKNGCPLPKDRDGDGILDDEDACPDEPGVRTDDPKTNGCPPRTVQVKGDEIIILEQVQFDTGKATIKKVSDKLLDEVAIVLDTHPEIKKLEVQGHTDDRGTPASNKLLSKARAAAVMKALTKRGISAGRLVSQGYGQDKPIETNKTDEGRAKNRRVQFIILDKAKR